MQESQEVEATQAHGNLILTAKGEAFKTEAAAQAVRTAKGFVQSHDVIPYENGFALRIRSGVPADQAQTPVHAVPRAKLTPEQAEAEAEQHAREMERRRGREPEGEKYYRIRIHDKATPDQENDFVLACNGEQLQLRRGDVLVLPGRFKEILDHTIEPQYRHEAGKDRQVVGYTRQYGYDFIEMATREDFIGMRDEGTRKAIAAREALQKAS